MTLDILRDSDQAAVTTTVRDEALGDGAPTIDGTWIRVDDVVIADEHSGAESEEST